MTSHKYLLSICIPTYNREKYLKILIDSIVNQDVFRDTNDIEIVIDDGPSQDNTRKLIQGYISQYGAKIRYIRNEKAIGMCAALLEAIELSNGEYTWLIGSDDVMTSISLQTVLGSIRQDSPGIILSDRREFSEDHDIHGSELHRGKENTVLDGADALVRYLGKRDSRYENTHFFTFMSIFCFKQELYRNNKQLFIEKYIKNTNYSIEKNYFNYIIILFYQITHEKIVIIRNEVLILARLSNTSGWSMQNGYSIIRDLFLSIRLFQKNYTVTLQCYLFFAYMLTIWTLPYIGYLIKKNRILRHMYAPLSKIVIKIFYKK